MESLLRAGIAAYNAGYYHAAHDAWEDRWLELEEGHDERLLHGLIQFTAAVHHAHDRNWEGAVGLAESAGAYLRELPADYRGVNVGTVRETLSTLASDPEVIERRRPPELRVDGRAVEFTDLDIGAVWTVAPLLAEAAERYDEATIDRAVEYARDDLDAGEEGSPFVTFVLDFVRDAENRGIIYQRLSQHVDRRRSRERDVEGLFE
ncbi:protein of unknown function [Natronoarchaeum philippinense]|uniref:DUF309 domain-containing protein n=1 Tax=Natronoarchaeum philippinense TaxID=558529 RepID=A0A285NS40_NATPI|nr:DUF309 domain-containing protein [Natronoarchaeum philippinense]SNZ12279.1 protein of unknown function [Natronoarchaeum philippinense]